MNEQKLLEDKRLETVRTVVKKPNRPHYKSLYEAEVRNHQATKTYYGNFIEKLNRDLNAPTYTWWDAFKGLFA